MVPDVLTLGPLAFPVERLLAVGLIWMVLAGSLWLARRDGQRARRAPWLAVWIGVLAARVSFVVSHWQAYAPDPATVAYVWQGGFEPVAGIIAAAAVFAFGMGSFRKVAGSVLILAVASGLWSGYLALEAQKPRRPFPDGIRLADLNGRPVLLDDLRGQPFVVNLWASWCGPCRREMPMFVEIASKTPGVAVLLVNQSEDLRLIQRFLKDEGLPAGNILSDRGAALSRLTDSPGLPTTIFVRSDGMIENAHTGQLSRAALLHGIERLPKR